MAHSSHDCPRLEQITNVQTVSRVRMTVIVELQTRPRRPFFGSAGLSVDPFHIMLGSAS
jgi:hypothetical protein